MPYAALYGLNIAIPVVSAMIAVVVATKPADLGLSPTVIAWAVVVQAGLTALAAILPSLLKSPTAHEAQLRALGKRRASDS